MYSASIMASLPARSRKENRACFYVTVNHLNVDFVEYCEVNGVAKQLLEEGLRQHDWMGTPDQRNGARGLHAGAETSPNSNLSTTLTPIVWAAQPRAFHVGQRASSFLETADSYYNGKIRSHPDIAVMYDTVRKIKSPTLTMA